MAKGGGECRAGFSYNALLPPHFYPNQKEQGILFAGSFLGLGAAMLSILAKRPVFSMFFIAYLDFKFLLDISALFSYNGADSVIKNKNKKFIKL